MNPYEFLKDNNRTISELQFKLAAHHCNNDIHCIMGKLLDAGLGKITDGLWVWDLLKNIELYDQTFRTTLGHKDKSTFPDVPESWQKWIQPASLKLAMDNFVKHVESFGKHRYIQEVVYNRPDGTTVTVVCHGIVVAWKEVPKSHRLDYEYYYEDKDCLQVPLVMVGVHPYKVKK